MDFEQIMEVCCEQMIQEFGITFKQAESLIYTLDLEDIVKERYENEIKEKEAKLWN